MTLKTLRISGAEIRCEITWLAHARKPPRFRRDWLAAAPRSARRTLHEGGGGDNRDVPKWIEHQQVVVAGQDEISATVHSEFEKLVVRGIATCRDAFSDRYKLRRLHQPRQPVARFRSDHRGDIGP